MRPGLVLLTTRRLPHLRKGGLRMLSTAPPKTESDPNVLEVKPDTGKHLKITAQNTRQPVIAKAVVTDVRQESPLVRGITLRVDNPHFSFKAGQWVDMFIPGVETVGGFSMYSCPSQLVDTGTMDLGIKFSKWPPAFWIHDQCKVGSQVAVRAGGDFYYAPEIGDPDYDILLIAGGVGVNPLVSMFSHASSLDKAHQENGEEYCPGKSLLLYSSKTYEELLYKPLLNSVSLQTPKFEVQYFTTRESPPKSSSASYGHITQEVLKAAIESLDLSSLKVFICGPPPMIESINQKLLNCGLSCDQIHFEKWW